MIKEALPKDCIDLAALSIQVWLHTYAVDGIRPAISKYVLDQFTEQYYQQLLENPEIKVLGYWRDNHLVACIVVDFTEKVDHKDHGFEIATLYVQEHFHQQGIGKALVEEVERRYGSTFWLSTWVHNKNAIDFYKYIGFSDIGSLSFCLDGEQHENRVLLHSGR